MPCHGIRLTIHTLDKRHKLGHIRRPGLPKRQKFDEEKEVMNWAREAVGLLPLHGLGPAMARALSLRGRLRPGGQPETLKSWEKCSKVT